MKQLKLTYEDFIEYAKKGMATHYQRLGDIEMVVARHDGEHTIAEYPDYVYIEIDWDDDK